MSRTRGYAFVLFSIGVGFAQAPVSITLTPSAVSLSAGKPLTFQAAASRTTKRVTFFDGATILGTAAVNEQGQASFSTAWLAAGQHQVYAVAPGGARSQPTEITIGRVASSSFGAAKHYAAGLTPNAMAIADFNGDGHLDIALAGASGISVLPGHGDGTFGSPVPTTAAFHSTAMAAADFDGDGLMDLAVADGTTGKIYFLRGAGDGTFAAPREIAMATNPVALAVGDFNGDGIADLAVADQAGNKVLLLLGAGDGSFRAPVRIEAGVGPAALAVGDFNSDGIADLAVVNFGSNDVTVLVGKGDGTFSSGVPLKVGNGPTAILMSDLNGDGMEDLAILNRLDATATVFYGKGDGSFQSAMNLPAGSTPVGIAAGDPDKSGFRALVIADGSELRWQQLTAPGAQRVVQIDAGGAANGIAVGDFTGDGRNGVVVADQDGVVWHPRDGFATHFSVSTISSIRAGIQFSVTVTALDEIGITVTDYPGTVQITSSDPQAQLPANSTLTNGVGTFLVTLGTVGSQTVTATGVSPSITGTSAAIAVSAGYPAFARIVSGANQSAVVGTAFATPLEITILDFFNNPVPGLTVKCKVPSSGASAVCSSPEVVTNASGMAAVTLTANAVPGAYLVMLRIDVPTVAGPRLLPRSEAPSTTFSLTNLPNVTVQTSPPGLAFTVDGTSYTTPQSFGFALNSDHIIAVSSPQAGSAGTQSVFQNWSDNRPASHYITATGTPVAYTATLLTQYQLTTSATPTAGGTVVPASGNFYNAGASVQLTAIPKSGYRLDHWNGVAGPSIVTTASIVMSGPVSVTAVFIMNPQISPAALNLQYNLGAIPSTVTGSLSVNTSDNSAFSVSGANAWLTASSSSSTTPATVTVKANAAGMQAGTYYSTLTLTFSDGSLSVVPIALTVVAMPQLVWTATPAGPLNFSVQSGATTVQSREIIVSATGQNVPLLVTTSVSSPAAGQWLSLSPGGNSSGTTPQAFNVHADPSGLAAGVYQGAIMVTSSTAGVSPLNIPVTLTLTAAPPAISISFIQNAASFSAGSEAPNTILSAFGIYPGCTSGAQVSVDGSPTTVFYSSPTQVNFLFPAGVSGETSASLQIECAGLKSAVIQLPVLNLAPAIFTVGQNGAGQAAIVNPDGSVATAAAPGSTIQIFGTGFGMLGPVGSDGLRHLLLPVTATIGGMPATVLFAGEAPGTTTGLVQINVQVPANAPQGPAIPLQLSVGGVSTAAGVTLAIQ
jgi:uncharacterized protein (TIGR03437 family)